MSDQIIDTLYDGHVNITLGGNHVYYIKVDGQRVPTTSVTTALGVIDKSGPLKYWAVNLAVDYTEKYLEDEEENALNGNMTDSNGNKIKYAKRLFSRNELINVLENARRQHTVRTTEAASLGSTIHGMIEDYVKAKINKQDYKIDEELDERVVNGFQAFLNWEKENKVEFLHSEKLIYSAKYGYVGTADCIAKLDGKLFLLDWKTGNAIYDEMTYQVSAYIMAREEEFPKEKYEGAIIVRLDKETGEFIEKEISLEEIKEGQDTFLHCLAIKNALKRAEQRQKELERQQVVGVEIKREEPKTTTKKETNKLTDIF